jgi:hypothetical protein
LLPADRGSDHRRSPLMLATLERLLTDAGGTYAFCDTDSMAIVATRKGGLVPCPGGPRTTTDGEEAVCALSWQQVDEIRERFTQLNPYTTPETASSLLELEDENFTDKTRSARHQLWCYSISAKRYALYTHRGTTVSLTGISGEDQDEDHEDSDPVCANPRNSCTVSSSGFLVATLGFWRSGRLSVKKHPNIPCGGGGKDYGQFGVPCTSLKACTSVGSVIYRWNGHRWSLSRTVPGNELLNGVSCTSSNQCTAVGGDYTTPAIVERWQGSMWSVARLPISTAKLSLLNGVSCVAANACIAVGLVGPGNGTPLPLVASFNLGASPTMTPGEAASGGTSYAPGVSCHGSRSTVQRGSGQCSCAHSKKLPPVSSSTI